METCSRKFKNTLKKKYTYQRTKYGEYLFRLFKVSKLYTRLKYFIEILKRLMFF
jgi:hypothetical protein